jgi:phosphoribosylformylglycinamidine cyclo-ligase
MTNQTTYKSSGVDIEAGEEAVRRIKESVRTTFSKAVLTDIGRFGGFYQPDLTGFKSPVLVSSIDGVGTKLKVAFMSNKHDTIGQDLVHHCINDIFAGGAKPLFFLDYIGTGKLSPPVVERILSGMVRGCRENECALVGGEMAEMPGFYQAGEYDVAGCIVGLVDRDKIIDGNSIMPGDALVGLASNGLHTNGYSLARHVLFEKAGFTVESRIDPLEGTLGEELLKVHRCYLKPVTPIINRFAVRGMSHITGGGIVGNTSRILPGGRSLEIDWDSWTVPPIFSLIQKSGHVPVEDMRRTFNMGIGFILVINPDDLKPVMGALTEQGEKPVVIGRVV